MIPRPFWLNERTSVKALCRTMPQISEDRLQELLKCIRHHAFLERNGKRILIRQLIDKWNAFRTKVLSEFPELSLYEDLWPVDAYYTIYTRVTKKKRGHKRAKTCSREQPLLSDASASLATSESRDTGKDGRSPKATMMQQVLDSETSLGASNNDSGGSHNTQVSTSLLEAKPSASESYTMNKPQMHTVDYPMACMRCLFRPPVPSVANQEIRNIFSGKENMVAILVYLGILSDHHLRILRKWGTRSFFASLSADNVNPIYAATISQHIGLDSVTRPLNEAIQLPRFRSYFDKPTKEEEERLTGSDSSLLLLRRTAGLDEDSFLCLVSAASEGCIDPSFKGFSSPVEWVVSACPFLQPYQDYWPVRFYMRWRLNNRAANKRKTFETSDIDDTMPSSSCCTLSSTHASSSTSASFPESSIPASLHTSSASSGHGIPSSACSIHGSTLPGSYDAPVRLLSLLQAFGMEELVPVFVAAGVKDEQDVDLFFGLPEEDKRSLVQKGLQTHDLKLNYLQDMMIGVVLSNVRLSD